MDEPILVVEPRGLITVLRLNRPAKANSLNPELMAELGSALLDAEADPEVRCVVLTATGRVFCGGMDLKAFAEGRAPREADRVSMEAFSRFCQGGAAVPVVAAAQGSAVAGGFELLLSCDMAVASKSARFGLPETKRGLFAAGGGVYLGARVPVAVALELNLTGDLIDAERAYGLGLVNRVVEPEEVLATALQLAEVVAQNGPLAVRASREIVKASAEDLDKARELWKVWQPVVFGSEDANEGSRAFVEKRPAVWKGR